MDRKKVVKPTRKKEKKVKDPNEEPKKRFFGRNLGTLLVIIGGVLVVVLLAVVITNVVGYTSKAGKCSPFSDGDTQIEVLGDTKIQRMSHNKFDLMELELKCTSWNEDKKKATFTLSAKATDKLEESKRKVTFRLCLATEPYRLAYSGDAGEFSYYEEYGSEYTRTLTDSSASTVNWGTYSSGSQSGGITILEEFPIKSKTVWPFYKTVTEPNAYLLVYYSYTVNGSAKKDAYVLSWSYSEYIKGSIGAIK